MFEPTVKKGKPSDLGDDQYMRGFRRFERNCYEALNDIALCAIMFSYSIGDKHTTCHGLFSSPPHDLPTT